MLNDYGTLDLNEVCLSAKNLPVLFQFKLSKINRKLKYGHSWLWFEDLSKPWWLLVIRISKNGPFKENLTLLHKNRVISEWVMESCHRWKSNKVLPVKWGLLPGPKLSGKQRRSWAESTVPNCGCQALTSVSKSGQTHTHQCPAGGHFGCGTMQN